jgi:hypothetical protein
MVWKGELGWQMAVALVLGKDPLIARVGHHTWQLERRAG